MGKRKARSSKMDNQTSRWPWTLTTAMFVIAFAASIWLIVSPDFEPLLAFIPSITALLIFFGLRNSKYQGYLDKIAAAFILILSFVIIFALVAKNKHEKQLAQATPTPSFPFVEIAFFEEDEGGRLKIVDPVGIDIPIGVEEIQNGIVAIPINLAVRNIGEQPLEIVRIELSYENSLKVESQGRTKIDPHNSLLIYEHEIGTLENVNNYTPLETIDTLYIPFDFVPVPVIILAKGGVPTYFMVITGLDGEALLNGQGFQGKEVSFDVRVYSKGNQPAAGTINFNLDTVVEIINYTANAEVQFLLPSEDDIELFTQLINTDAIPLDSWNVREPTMGLIGYRKIRYKEGTYQLIFVDHQLRLVNGDIDGDGNLDFEMYDETYDQVPDQKVVYFSPVEMIDWPEEAAR